MKRLAIVLVVLIILLIVVIPLGLWNSHGNLLDVAAGQTAAHSVQVNVDLSKPVSTVALEYLSFAIDLSQRDLMV